MSVKRKLINDEIVEDLDESVEIKINTYCPDKYRLVDLETGETWQWDTDLKMFRRADGISVMSVDGDN
jgi:hypothetical protein